MSYSSRKIVIMQHRLLHYRVKFFQQLRDSCAKNGIDLYLVHGQPTKTELKKNDVGKLEWADVVTNNYINVWGRDILWQPFPKHHLDADLVVMMQENRLVSNYPWLFWRNHTEAKVAYWGHGRNFQAQAPAGLREKWKQFLLGRVDWWFAYTSMTRDIVLADGYPDERITVLNNAIDNEGFQENLASITEQDLSALRRIVGNGPVGLFCGSLYPDKRIDFMISAAEQIRKIIPDFSLVIIGDGPSGQNVQAASQSRSWLHAPGVKRGKEKAAWFKLASIVFNPGAVGLHVVESFCAGTPMVTMADARHGPEIAYLNSGENGLIITGDSAEYAHAIVELLSDPVRLAAMGSAALESASLYTLDNMVKSFREGIDRCLAAPKNNKGN